MTIIDKTKKNISAIMALFNIVTAALFIILEN